MNAAHEKKFGATLKILGVVRVVIKSRGLGIFPGY